MNKDWSYYNHAIIPNCYPHENANVNTLDSAFRDYNKAFFARWTENWDCGYETQFGACISDKPFDINTLKAKRRYEINKGNKNFYCKILSKIDLNAMYDVYLESLQGYLNAETKFSDEELNFFCKNWESTMCNPNTLLLGVFEKDTDLLCGYAHCVKHDIYIPISTFKTRVSKERNGVNFALMYGIYEFYEQDLKNGAYLCDGYRNILHETQFQAWLEKYFQFRKAYCVLHIKYKGILKFIIPLMCKFRKLVEAICPLKYKNLVSAMFNMEEWSV